jgi:hypothetical protein
MSDRADPNDLTPLERLVFRTPLDRAPRVPSEMLQEECIMPDEHQELKDAIRRIDVELDGHERESARVITELSTSFGYIKLMLEKQVVLSERNEERMNMLEMKLDQYNNLRERIDLTEECMRGLSQAYVPRHEINAAMGSVRQFTETKVEGISGKMVMLVWAIGIGFSTVGGVLGFIASRVFG